MQFGNIQATSVKIFWKPVLDNGGSEVSNYVVERREVEKTTWFTVDNKVHNTHCTVSGKNYPCINVNGFVIKFYRLNPRQGIFLQGLCRKLLRL